MPQLATQPAIFFVLLSLISPTHAQEKEKTGFCTNTYSSNSVSLHDAVIAAVADQPQLMIARQEVEKAKANLLSALTPFLPSGNLSFQNEHFVPNNTTPPIVIGSTFVGGTQSTYSSYASLGINWNLYNGGRDIAGYRGAEADIRSSQAALANQMNETLVGIINAYNDLYKEQ